MLVRLPLTAADPARVAAVLAELTGGEAASFPPAPEHWIVLAGGTAAIVVGPGDGRGGGEAAIATGLGLEQVLGIAEREGWPARLVEQDGLFAQVTLLLEGRTSLAVLTPQMQHEHRAAMTPANWRRFLDDRGAIAPMTEWI